MLTVTPVFLLSGCSRMPTEEDKIRTFLNNGGLDQPTSSRYAKLAHRNGWTLEFIKLVDNLLKNDSYLKSNDIRRALSFSPNEYDSPIGVKRHSHNTYQFIMFVGTKNTFDNSDVTAIMCHEIRHVKIMEYQEQLLKKNPDISLKNILKERAVIMFGNTANEIFNRFFDRLTKLDIFTSEDEVDDFVGYVIKLMDETTVWANATEIEYDVRFYNKYIEKPLINIDKANNVDEYSNIRMIMGLAYFKVISDKHKIENRSEIYSKYCAKYNNNDLFKDTYALLDLCYDVSKKYFPK